MQLQSMKTILLWLLCLARCIRCDAWRRKQRAKWGSTQVRGPSVAARRVMQQRCGGDADAQRAQRALPGGLQLGRSGTARYAVRRIHPEADPEVELLKPSGARMCFL